MSFLFFIVWLSFIDDDSFVVQYQLYQQEKNLSHKKERLEKDLISIKEDVMKYKLQPELLERYARENYFMKKDNETLFILIEK